MNQNDWLTQTLEAAFPSHELVHLDVKRIGEAYGFASQIYRVGWQHDGQSLSVVAKIWPLKNESSLAELRFFQLAVNFNIHVPKYFYGTADHKRQQVVLTYPEKSGVAKKLKLFKNKELYEQQKTEIH
ncbi:MAG: hypothetical protein AAGD96_36125, partial [Chloroflexota bacterium]